MSAYTFWHRPFAHVDRKIYEDALIAFHHEFAKQSCTGFQGSATYRISEVPWLDGLPAYEDWNFIESSAVLDPLNTVAVAPDMWDVHACIASKTDVGYGGIYYHVFGDTDPTELKRIAWLKRPRGIRFETSLKEIAETVHGPVSVWRKQMVLGPAWEFALVGDSSLMLDLPEGWEVLYINRELLHCGTAK